MKGIPNIDKPVTKQTCQSMYWNLLDLETKFSDIRASPLIREFFQTIHM